MKKYYPLCVALALAWPSLVVRGDDSPGQSPSPDTRELAPVAADWSMKPSGERPHSATVWQRILPPTARLQDPGNADPLSTLDLESGLGSSSSDRSRKPGCDDDRVAKSVEVVAASLDASPDPDFGQSPSRVAPETQRTPSVPAIVSAQVACPATAVCQAESSADQSSARPPLNPCTSPAPAGNGREFVGELPQAVVMSGTDDVIESQARKLTDEGLKLAAKGSTFSAQAKYIEALQLIAVSLDAKHDTECHAQDLTSGLLALREADDFAVAPIGASQAELEPATISVAHTTPLLKTATRSRVTRLKALQLYYSYATKKFVTACGGLPEASRALSCLGRLQPFLSEGFGRKATLTEPKALAFYQAAVMVDPKNFIAANELGVVLAQCGKLNSARKALLYSTSLRRRSETFHNLAVVYRRLGDDPHAKWAAGMAQEERRAESNGVTETEPTSLVYWVDHKAFVTRASATDFIAPSPPNGQEDQTKTLPAGTPQQGSPVPSQATRPGLLDLLFSSDRRFARSSATSGRPSLTETADNSSKSDDSHLESESYLTPETQQGSQSAQASVVPIASEQNGGLGMPSVPRNWSPQNSLEPFSWEVFAQGEYIGPARLQHVPEYYLRVDDGLEFVFRLSGKPSARRYRLNVGDVIRVASRTVATLSLEALVQPDGTIVLPQVGSVVAAGKSIDVLRADLDERFRAFMKEPAIVIAPVSVNKTLEEFRAAIVNRQGVFAGQSFHTKVSPNGMVQLPAIGSVPVQGLSLTELRNEVESRYAEMVDGIEVTPVLSDRAPRAVYVLGEVAKPGRFTLEAPTTVIQAIAMAGSWNIGGNVREVIVFRRDEQWRLMATRVNVKPALYNYRCLDGDDIWLRDSDIVIVPKCHMQVLDDVIQLVFTKGVYGVFPLTFYATVPIL
jgi:polysaccharide biosynthesis/export protein